MQFSNIRVDNSELKGEGSRPAVICDDVDGLSISGLYLSETFSGTETIQLHDVQNVSVAGYRLSGDIGPFCADAP